jgi:beta-ribofuranosylaminobenzene 5'-phosphate synthase
MKTVRIEAPARLHWGLFDIGGSLGRLFGGLGVAVSHPMVVLEASFGDKLTVEGPAADRVLEFARCYMANTGIQGGAHLRVEEIIPDHVGLGSGTKLALTVAYALAKLYDQVTDPHALSQAVGRKTRSAVGLWTFAEGGLVVEGGRRTVDSAAPLLFRYDMPEGWYGVLAVPDQLTGLSGLAEVDAFARLSPTQEQSARISHVVLMSLLPALVEQDLEVFGGALTQVQELVGECFSTVQGGTFSNPISAKLINAFLEWGAAGAGQSSWGPTVYGLVADEEQGHQLVDKTMKLLNGQGWVELIKFDNCGVRAQST